MYMGRSKNCLTQVEITVALCTLHKFKFLLLYQPKLGMAAHTKHQLAIRSDVLSYPIYPKLCHTVEQ